MCSFIPCAAALNETANCRHKRCDLAPRLSCAAKTKICLPWGCALHGDASVRRCEWGRDKLLQEEWHLNRALSRTQPSALCCWLQLFPYQEHELPRALSGCSFRNLQLFPVNKNVAFCHISCSVLRFESERDFLVTSKNTLVCGSQQLVISSKEVCGRKGPETSPKKHC